MGVGVIRYDDPDSVKAELAAEILPYLEGYLQRVWPLVLQEKPAPEGAKHARDALECIRQIVRLDEAAGLKHREKYEHLKELSKKDGYSSLSSEISRLYQFIRAD